MALCPRLSALCPHPEPWTSHQLSWEWKEQPLALIWERTVQLNANISQLCERAQCLRHTAAIPERVQARQDQGILVCWATSAIEQTQGVTEERHSTGRHARTSWWSSLTVPKGNGGTQEAMEWNGLAHTSHSFVLLCFLIPTFTCTRMHVPKPAEMVLVQPGSPNIPFC